MCNDAYCVSNQVIMSRTPNDPPFHAPATLKPPTPPKARKEKPSFLDEIIFCNDNATYEDPDGDADDDKSKNDGIKAKDDDDEIQIIEPSSID